MRTLVLMAVLTLEAAAVAAPPATSADALIERGIDLRVRGKPAEALALFEQANKLAPSARATAQMGLAEISLHHWLEAETHLQAALTLHDSEWIENQKTLQALEKSLADVELHVAKVRLEGTPGADVFVDGKSVGRLPLSGAVHVNPGPVKIRATAPGHQPVEKEVVGTSGEEVIANLELDPIPVPGVIEPAASAPAFGLAQPMSESAPHWRKWTALGLIAGGGAAVTAGIVWLAVDGKGTGNCSPAPGGVCPRLYDTSLQGWIAIGAGAALAAGGSGLLLWNARHQELGVALTPTALFATGRF